MFLYIHGLIYLLTERKTVLLTLYVKALRVVKGMCVQGDSHILVDLLKKVGLGPPTVLKS